MAQYTEAVKPAETAESEPAETEKTAEYAGLVMTEVPSDMYVYANEDEKREQEEYRHFYYTYMGHPGGGTTVFASEGCYCI